jgi:hypothetical protein
VVNDEPLVCTKKLYEIIRERIASFARPAASVADNMSVAFGKPREFGWIEPRIHAGQDVEVPRRWHRQLCFFTEGFCIGLVCVKRSSSDGFMA